MDIQAAMKELLSLDGAMATAVVDSNSGMVLGKEGTGIDLDLAGAGNTEVVKAKMRTMESLGLNDQIEDILISLGSQYHIIRPSSKKKGLFLYYVVSKRGNLALARHKAAEVEQALTI
ncbi:MAG: hypothetical protein KDC27_11265 [Acidobacteria bacterium]|nr:hypothetical protein [Acidobacteriota bacterium]